MIYIPDVLLTIFYACFGIILMLTANTVIDFFVPGKFSEEIKRGGIVASVVYAVLGIILFVTGYMFINIWHRKYKLSEEIMRGNTAAGILVFGIFVGLALVISGAVH